MSPFYRIMTGITGMILIAGLGGFCIYQYFQKNQSLPEHIKKNQQIGKEDSEFTVYDLNTNAIALSSLRNKVVIINFWATWCAPCIEELPSLNKLAEHYPEKLIILAVSNERADTIKNFLMAFPDFHSNFIPSNIGRKQMLTAFSVRAFPETYILNKKGQLVEKIVGQQEWDSDNWKNKIKALIEKL